MSPCAAPAIDHCTVSQDRKGQETPGGETRSGGGGDSRGRRGCDGGGAGGGAAVVSAFRYVILGTVGAALYLLAVGYLYSVTGTLNMADLADRLPSPADATLFELNPDSRKRSLLVTELLGSSNFSAAQSRYWRDVIFSRATDTRSRLMVSS